MGEFRPSQAVSPLHPWCQKCGHDLSALDQAVFCPACGQKIRRITPPSRVARFARGTFHIITLGKFKPAEPFVYTPGGTRILIGYGKAMFNLGWRYERGGSSTRNLPEAIRCYKKSARLGNVDASVRLAIDETAETNQAIPIES